MSSPAVIGIRPRPRNRFAVTRSRGRTGRVIYGLFVLDEPENV